jgi:transposase
LRNWTARSTTHTNSRPALKSATELVKSVPGIQQTPAAALVAETGADMGHFPGGGKLASWIGICPGNNESAGKRKSGQTRKGNPWAKRALVECAWSASRKKDSEPKRYYERVQPRLKHKRALVATAHLMTLKVYQALSTGQPYSR